MFVTDHHEYKLISHGPLSVPSRVIQRYPIPLGGDIRRGTVVMVSGTRTVVLIWKKLK